MASGSKKPFRERERKAGNERTVDEPVFVTITDVRCERELKVNKLQCWDVSSKWRCEYSNWRGGLIYSAGQRFFKSIVTRKNVNQNFPPSKQSLKIRSAEKNTKKRRWWGIRTMVSQSTPVRHQIQRPVGDRRNANETALSRFCWDCDDQIGRFFV